VDHGPGTHGAGFDGDEQLAVSKTVVAKGGSGLAQGDDFSMRRRIRVGQIAIESPAYDLAFLHHDGADRNFSYVERSLGSTQRLLHPQFVVFSASAVSHEEYCMRMAAPSALAQMN
jgi:hypothetical protein